MYRTSASSLRVPSFSIAEFDDHAIVIISLVRSPPISHIKDFIDAVVYGKPSLHKAWRKPVPMDSGRRRAAVPPATKLDNTMERDISADPH